MVFKTIAAFIFLMINFTISTNCRADDQSTGSVIIENGEDFTKPYKTRRGANAFLLGLHSENYYPFNYQSQFGSKFVEDLIGLEAIKLMGLELGYKRNINIGSLSVLFDYSMGKVNGQAANESLDVSRLGLSINAALDGFLNEPYVVPYAQVGLHQYSISEDKLVGAEIESRSGSSGAAFHYKYGLLFQIDWIESAMDAGAKAERLRSSGLENTYIDVYFADYLPSSEAQDSETLGAEGNINTASSSEIGIGLKLEF